MVRGQLVPHVGQRRIGRSALGPPFRLASDRRPVGGSLVGDGSLPSDRPHVVLGPPLRGDCRPPLEATSARRRRGDCGGRWHPRRHAPHAIRAPGGREPQLRPRNVLPLRLHPSGSVAGRSSTPYVTGITNAWPSFLMVSTGRSCVKRYEGREGAPIEPAADARSRHSRSPVSKPRSRPSGRTPCVPARGHWLGPPRSKTTGLSHVRPNCPRSTVIKYCSAASLGFASGNGNSQRR